MKFLKKVLDISRRTDLYTSTRRKITLSIDETLSRNIKVQAVMENRDVSDITEDLYREYLDRQKKWKVKVKSPRP